MDLQPPVTIVSVKKSLYAQLTIPVALRHAFNGQTQLRRSLRTNDHRLAKQLVHAKATEMYSELAEKAPDPLRESYAALNSAMNLKPEVTDPKYLTDHQKALLLARATAFVNTPLEHNVGDEDEMLLALEIEKGRRALQTFESSSKNTISLSEAVDFRLKDNPYASIKTANAAKNSLKKFSDFIGEKALSDLTKHDGYRFADHMKEEGYAKKTIAKAISFVSVMLTGFEQSGKIERNPFDNIKLSSFGSPSAAYSSFSRTELTKLFSQRMPSSHRLLLSILITTGMRLDEAALLDWSDIKTEDGVEFFDLTESGKLVKNIGSRRRVPVPKVLGNILNREKFGEIFTFSRDADGKSQAAASKALMRQVRRVTDDRTKVVHSLRGTLKDLLRDAGVDKEINDFITGHSSGDVAGKYGAGPSLAKRAEALNSVEHPWLKSLDL